MSLAGRGRLRLNGLIGLRGLKFSGMISHRVAPPEEDRGAGAVGGAILPGIGLQSLPALDRSYHNRQVASRIARGGRSRDFGLGWPTKPREAFLGLLKGGEGH